MGYGFCPMKLTHNTVQGISLKKYWFQNEAKCTTIQMEISFIYIIIKNQFNING